MSFDSLMNQQARLLRRTTTQDAIGGKTETWVPVKLFVPCRIVTLSMNERMIMGSRGVDVTNRIFTRWDAVHMPSEKDKYDVDGVIYQIEGIDTSSKLGHHLEILVREIRDGGGSGG